MPKNFETEEFIELCGNASISQLKQLKPLHVTHFNCNLQQNQGEGSNFKIKCNIISTMIACAYSLVSNTVDLIIKPLLKSRHIMGFST